MFFRFPPRVHLYCFLRFRGRQELVLEPVGLFVYTRKTKNVTEQGRGGVCECLLREGVGGRALLFYSRLTRWKAFQQQITPAVPEGTVAD